MARIHLVTARKEYICGRCQSPIPKGEKYYTWKNRRRQKSYRCRIHYPRPSETTTSDHLATLYGIQESLVDDITSLERDELSLENLAASLESAAEGAREEGESYNESADNVEEYFSGSEQVEEIREKASACDNWADMLDQAASEVRSLDEGELTEEEKKSDAAAVVGESASSLEL